jgi:hypothetical protein
MLGKGRFHSLPIHYTMKITIANNPITARLGRPEQKRIIATVKNANFVTRFRTVHSPPKAASL